MQEPLIGIDLGTTNSAAATVEDGQPRIIPSRQGRRLTPSMVGFNPRNGERLVGLAAEKLAEEHPESVAWATKRFLGRRFSPELVQAAKAVVPYALQAGPTGDARVKLYGRALPLTQVSAMVLTELKLDATTYFGRPVARCVITVPANFDDTQRQATREAALMAGLEVVRILNEPTAAALAYGLSRGFEGSALVFDLGGGTFDVTILEIEDGVYQVRATGGDPSLGGEDFDQAIVQWLLAQVEEPLRELVTKDVVSLRRLKVAAEKAKRELSEGQEALISVGGLGDHGSGAKRLTQETAVETVLTRPFFETLCEPLVRRCLAACDSVMREAGLKQSQVDTVLLVGGMTRVPVVRRAVESFFGRPPSTEVNPDEAVALGAAIHADELGRQSGAALLMDVVSQSLSVGVLGGKVKKLIAKNRPVPAVAKDIFYPATWGQTEARIPVFQGEGELQEDNKPLGELVLRKLSGGPRTDSPLEVTFELSGEGMLSVRATDLTTGVSESVKLEARSLLLSPEAEALADEEAQYYKQQAAADARQVEESFRKLLERGQRAAELLQAGGDAERTPSDDEQSAVAAVQTLLEQGRGALKAKDAEQRARVAHQLTRLLEEHEEEP
jgi:molecular chaperone DnaK